MSCHPASGLSWSKVFRFQYNGLERMSLGCFCLPKDESSCSPRPISEYRGLLTALAASDWIVFPKLMVKLVSCLFVLQWDHPLWVNMVVLKGFSFEAFELFWLSYSFSVDMVVLEDYSFVSNDNIHFMWKWWSWKVYFLCFQTLSIHFFWERMDHKTLKLSFSSYFPSEWSAGSERTML